VFLEAEDYEFTRNLENSWMPVKQELENLQGGDFIPWPEKFLYKESWDVFGLFAFGRKIERNCQLCPKTTELVERIPGMTTAGFSSLGPGTKIVPHKGYTNTVLRCHLGLKTQLNCGLRVGSETRHWEEGKCLIFDDTLEYEA
jgi:ornithine lipid ester-linked acyl 2-hydroxylase